MYTVTAYPALKNKLKVPITHNVQCDVEMSNKVKTGSKEVFCNFLVNVSGEYTKL